MGWEFYNTARGCYEIYDTYNHAKGDGNLCWAYTKIAKVNQVIHRYAESKQASRQATQLARRKERRVPVYKQTCSTALA